MRLDRAGLLALALAALCAAQGAMPAGNDWAALDADTRKLLAPWQENWSALPAAERGRLVANATRWQQMDAAARKDLLKRLAAWQALPPQERARIRARYAAWKALPHDEQVRVHAAAQQFLALPAPRQGALRATFATQDAGSQEAWLQGPADGAWIGKARLAFPFVPDQERDATMRMLRDLAPDAREQLFVLAARLSGDQREKLRKDLLLQPPRERPDLIREKLSK